MSTETVRLQAHTAGWLCVSFWRPKSTKWICLWISLKFESPPNRVHELFFWSLYLTNLQLPYSMISVNTFLVCLLARKVTPCRYLGLSHFQLGFPFQTQKICPWSLIFPSILPLFTTYLNDSGNLQQQSKQRSLDFPHPGHLFLPICLNGGPSGRGGQSQLAPFQVEDQQI